MKGRELMEVLKAAGYGVDTERPGLGGGVGFRLCRITIQEVRGLVGKGWKPTGLDEFVNGQLRFLVHPPKKRQ